MTDRLIDRLFLGAGAMKAGTTWLYAVLAEHPGIHFCPEKEIHYFYARHVRPEVLSERNRLEAVRRKYLGIDPDRSRAANVRARLRWAANYLDGPVDDAWYRALFGLRPEGAWAADFSNLYALLPEEAWRRIHARTGELRVLYTLRAPLERLWSHVKFHLAVTGQADRLGRWSPAEAERFARQPFIWENAEYGAALRRMRAALPESARMLLIHEELHADERAGLARIERFLGLPPASYPAALLARRVNATAPSPVPAHFRDSFARDIARILSELAAEGVAVPDAWHPEASLPGTPAAV